NTSGCVVADSLRPGLDFRRVRQHPADQACPGAGWLRLGDAGLRRRLWWLHGLVRLLRRRRAVEHVPGSPVGRELDTSGMARRRRLRDRLRRAPADLRLEPANDPGLTR